MDGQVINYGYVNEEDMDTRKGPWTLEEDAILADYISIHGEGRWNAVARSSGLKRTGKSCRLRWLNYLRPDVRRGNITLQEQLMILELHSRWGNRWSKIAQYLPGRTDNEIKNYWRTRVQKQAKQLKCDVNSKQFRDAMRYVWMPRIMERIRASESNSNQPATTATATAAATATTYSSSINNLMIHNYVPAKKELSSIDAGSVRVDPNFVPELSGTSSDSWDTQVSPLSGLTESQNESGPPNGHYSDGMQSGWGFYPGNVSGCWGWDKQQQEVDVQENEKQSNCLLLGGGDSLESLLWDDENIWFLQQQLM